MRRIYKQKIWPAFLGALALILAGFGWGDAFARGGRGGGGMRGGGGRGMRGGSSGRGGRGFGRGRGSGSGRNSQERKEKDKQERLEERQRRVELARIEYAKRERQKLWEEELHDDLQSWLGGIINRNTE